MPRPSSRNQLALDEAESQHAEAALQLHLEVCSIDSREPRGFPLKLFGGTRGSGYESVPKETRPSTLNNTYNEYVCGAMSMAMSPILEQGIHSSENGFARGRQLLQNPVVLDLEAKLQPSGVKAIGELSPLNAWFLRIVYLA